MANVAVILWMIILCCQTHFLKSQSLRQNQTWPTRVYPGHLSFPDHKDLYYIGSHLDGKLISPYDQTYMNISYSRNIRKTKLPGLIILPYTVEDVQRMVIYARSHNLHLTVRSSGHDYIGRSTHDGSMNLYLTSMNKIQVNLNSARSPAGEVKVQSGASWLQVYTEVDKIRGPDATGTQTVGRVVVGGSAHTVCMGGYTQGGGHSPISRKFGLAVDNLLEATIVTAEGKIRVLNSTQTITYDFDGSVHVTNDTDLFWAIRGGGGGTWGVVVDFTFKLHYPPERFRNVLAVIPLFDQTGNAINKKAVEDVFSILNGLSPEWGGYIYTGNEPVAGTQFLGRLMIFMNHFGSNSSESNNEISSILHHPSVIYTEDHYYNSFLNYEVHAVDAEYSLTYVFNSLIRKEVLHQQTSRAQFVDTLHELLKDSINCMNVMIGGNMAVQYGGSTPVHSGLRNGIFSTSCAKSWPISVGYADEQGIDTALRGAQKLYAYGYGSYINEPAEDMPDWKLRFWENQTTYNRLLNVKKKVDPDNFFWCHNCVGSDLGRGYAPANIQGLPGMVSGTFHPEVEFDQIITSSNTHPGNLIIG
uniref:FAD-binding PCMH-type domain-containing protein n=1 Tax=Biomphalaria glabrata TaxID=6526 RepID=A0A2C9KXU7_BIOGL